LDSIRVRPYRWSRIMSIITTDMAKAKEIHKTNIRYARTPLLAALDIDFQNALETAVDTALGAY